MQNRAETRARGPIPERPAYVLLPPNTTSPNPEYVERLNHEAKNPLAIIRGHVQLLQQHLQRPDALTEPALPTVLAQLAVIAAAVKRVVTAIDAFAQADAPEREEQRPSPRPEDRHANGPPDAH